MFARSLTVAALSALLVTLGAGSSLASVGGTVDQGDAAPTSTSTPSESRVLPSPRHGRTALAALGDRVGDVAARNHLSGKRLRTLLSEDHTAWLSREGQLFYQEDAPAQGAAADSAGTAVPTYPVGQTFALHSRPGASKTIFLDFDGAAVSNTAWNGTGSGMIPNGSHIGYDTDGAPTTFSTAERGWIQEVWRQVSETYSPFDVDVTTADPGSAALTRSTTSDTTYGTKVVITSSTTPRQQACGSCLGVAWVGSFDRVDSAARYQPAWVFAYDKGFDPMIIAQAASHETGHTLGLQHDATASASYYAGSTGWGPIMGSSAYRAVSQFSRGEYAGANNTEDDLAIIASHGLAPRADDHGSSVSAADQLGAKSAYDAGGVIGTRTDTDVFGIDLPCTTTLTASATGIGAQTAVDLSLEVLDAQGARVTLASPAAGRAGSPPVSKGMDAQVSVPDATGRYYLRVDGVGSGDPAGYGWSDYGSVGQYRLASSGCADAAPAPTTTPSATSTPAATPAPTATPKAAPAVKAPSTPQIGLASPGTAGGHSNAVARWAAPTQLNGASITKYRVIAQQVDARHRVVRNYTSAYLSPASRTLSLGAAPGELRLQGDGLEQGRRLGVVRGVTHRRCSLRTRAAPGPCVRRPGRRSATSEPGSPAGSCRSAP